MLDSAVQQRPVGQVGSGHELGETRQPLLAIIWKLSRRKKAQILQSSQHEVSLYL